MSVTVSAHDFETAGEKLRGAEKPLQKEVRRAIGAAARPIVRDVLREGLEKGFPGHRGGLIDFLSSSRVQVNVSRDWAGVRAVLGDKRHGVGRMVRQGYVRHPVFGNRNAWANTAIPNPEAFQAAINARVDEIKAAVVGAMQTTIEGMK